jgi:hypothetical protein
MIRIRRDPRVSAGVKPTWRRPNLRARVALPFALGWLVAAAFDAPSEFFGGAAQCASGLWA